MYCTPTTPLHCTYYIAPSNSIANSTILYSLRYSTTTPLHFIVPLCTCSHSSLYPSARHCSEQCSTTHFTSTRSDCTLRHGAVIHTALYFTALHYTVQCSTLHYISQHFTSTVLHCILLHGAVFYTAFHCTHYAALYSQHYSTTTSLHSTARCCALYKTLHQHCTPMYFTALHCIL